VPVLIRVLTPTREALTRINERFHAGGRERALLQNGAFQLLKTKNNLNPGSVIPLQQPHSFATFSTKKSFATHFKKIEINLSSHPIEYQGIPVIFLIDSNNIRFCSHNGVP
jgi:hypothetical protein